jgi:uncharacterized SAM-binding protein YcdF (DUF218 family)
MFYLKKLLSALALPPFSLIALALLGLWLSRKHARSGRAIAALALLALLALSLPPVSDALMRSLEIQPPISAQRLARAQAIVILGGGTYPDAPEYGGDTVSGASLERVRYGAFLQKRSKLPILVTGGAPYGGRPEGELMKEAIEREFQGQVKWVEAASRDTAENALYSAAMLKPAGVSRIALVSNGWHLPRAIELFKRQGFEVLAAPTGFTTDSPSLFAQALPSAGALMDSSTALHEWLGLFVQRLMRTLSG